MTELEGLEEFKKTHFVSNEALRPNFFEEFTQLIILGMEKKKFFKELKTFGSSETCSVVWSEKAIIYKCYTCARVPVMALCEECFEPALHEGHDFNMLITNSLVGRCDCGDSEAMDPAAFCEKSKNAKNSQPVPPHYTAPTKSLIPSFIAKMVSSFLKNPKSNNLYFSMLDLLYELAEKSYKLREIIAEAFTDTAFFWETDPKLKIFSNQNSIKTAILKDYALHKVINNVKKLEKESKVFVQKHYLDTLYLFFVKNNFDKRIAKFLILLSSIKSFKKALYNTYTKNYLFSCNYTNFGRSITKIDEIQYTSLSIQLLSTTKVIDKHNIFLSHLSYLFKMVLTYYNNEGAISFHVYDTNSVFIDSYCPIATDFLFLIGNKNGFLAFIKNNCAVSIWIKTVQALQGIDVLNKLQERPYETKPAYHTFNSVFEICMLPALTLFEYVTEEETEETNRLLLKINQSLTLYASSCEQKLSDVSLHLPLHRLYSLCVATCTRKSILKSSHVTLTDVLIEKLVQFPIRVWAGAAEMVNKVWERLGRMVASTARFYKCPQFSALTVDPDLFFIQLAASQIQADSFVHLVLWHFQSLEAIKKSEVYKGEAVRLYMLDEVLFFFVLVATTRVLSGVNEKGLLREEFVSILAIGDKTYSEIEERIPNRGPFMSKYLVGSDKYLQELAIFTPPTLGPYYSWVDGKYNLKPEYFLKEYNPIMVRLRSICASEYEKSITNFNKCAKEAKLFKEKLELWPPFNQPKIALCPEYNDLGRFLWSLSLHGFLFVILYQCLYENLRDSCLYTTIYLLNLSFSLPLLADKPTSHLFPLYQSCLIQFDRVYGVLDNDGLLFLFDDKNLTSVSEIDQEILEKRNNTPKSISNPFNVNPSKMRETRRRVEESILSLLLKLFEKHTNKIYLPLHMNLLSVLFQKLVQTQTFQDQNSRYLGGPDEKEYGSKKVDGPRIGGAEMFIGEVLDKLIKMEPKIKSFVDQYAEAENKMAKHKNTKVKQESRKRQVQKKKETLKKEMEVKKQKMLKKLNLEITSDEEEETSECCYCHENLTDPNIRPYFALGLLTRTKIMGNRLSKLNELMTYDVEDTYEYNFRVLQTFTKNILPDYKVFFEWYDSPWLQTCEHLIHEDCFHEFMKFTLTKFKRTPKYFEYHEREFWCPKCSQLCNCVYPPPEQALHVGGDVMEPSYEHIEHILKEAPKGKLKRKWKDMYTIFINKANNQKYSFEYYVDVLRNNIELYLMNKRVLNNLKNPFKPCKKTNLNIVYTLCRSFGRLHDVETNEIRKTLKVITESKEDFKTRNIALIDVKQLLAYTFLLISEPSLNKSKQTVVYFLNLYLLHLLTWMVAFSDEQEVKKFIEDNNLSECELGFILAFLIESLRKSSCSKHETETRASTFEKRLETCLRDFLKFAFTLFSCAVYPTDDSYQNIETTDIWSIYKNLLGNNFEGDHISCVRCFGWDKNTLNLYLEKFCKHTNFLTKSSEGFEFVEKMLTTDWKPPNLIPLANNYIDLHKQIDEPTKVPLQTCLICFSRSDKILEHVEKCGRGTCLYIDPRENVVRIVWQNRFMPYTSLYINKHGQNAAKREFEEMTLRQERYNIIQNMWLFNSFDMFCKQWEFLYH